MCLSILFYMASPLLLVDQGADSCAKNAYRAAAAFAATATTTAAAASTMPLLLLLCCC